MKTREFRSYINRTRKWLAKRGGKKNGVLPPIYFDFGARGPHTDKRAKRPRYRMTEMG